jgi:CheY-like chemotaxis protein
VIVLSWTHTGTGSIATSDQRATRVLIVDDEEASRGFVERVLRLAGYETAVAGDGLEAIRIAEDHGPFDLLLADVVMPGMQGDELARHLRGRDPELKILYFTGYSDRLFRERAVLWESEAFLEKPVTVNGLLEAVSLMLFGHTRQGARGPFADMAYRRSPRVATGPLRVRIGGAIGLLVNVSATGALVRVPEALAPESEWPALIEIEPEPVELRARVVRSHPLSIPLPGATARRPEYAVALAFTELPPRTKAALETLCGDALSKHE